MSKPKRPDAASMLTLHRKALETRRATRRASLTRETAPTTSTSRTVPVWIQFPGQLEPTACSFVVSGNVTDDRVREMARDLFTGRNRSPAPVSRYLSWGGVPLSPTEVATDGQAQSDHRP